MLQTIATVLEADAFGITVSEQALLRASTRIRSYTRQQITSGTSTINARGPVVALPQRPTRSVTAVYDHWGDQVGYWVNGNELNTRFSHTLTITYDHGFVTVPDELIELTATIAARLSNLEPAAAAGVQSESGGNESVTFGFDSYNAITELATGEKRVLDRIFPKLARTVVQIP